MDDGGSPYIGLCICIILIIIDAALHGFRAALDNLNESNIEKLAEGENKKAIRLQKALDKPSCSIHNVQLIVTGITLCIGAGAGRYFTGWQKVPALFLSLAAILLLGIYTPQKVAERKAEKWALSLYGLVHAAEVLLFPFVWILDQASNLLSMLFGVDPHKQVDDVTEEEIISMVNEGHEQGVLLASEAEMIHNIFEFGDKEAKDIMTHRKNIVALDGNMPFRETLDFMVDSSNSRFPVYLDDIDNIIGVLHIKEALQNGQKKELLDKPIKDIKGLVREVDFIPETRNINVLFKEMQSAKNHMVIVVDEYGQTSGIVAMEDILEEIVGNIQDEHDEDDETIQKQGENRYLILGMASFEEVAKLLELPEEDCDYETLNGYLISKIDKIPSDGEVFDVEADGWSFHVLAVENKMIQRVAVERIQKKKEMDGEDSSCQKKEMMIE